MKKALLILHQKKSTAGDIEIKLKKRGFEIEFIIPPIGHELPNNLDNYSLVVVFGGPMSANDNDDYLIREINFMKLVIESNIPYLGICLGAQLLAKYLGSPIIENQNKLSEIGFYKIIPSHDGKNLFKNQNYFYQFHNEGFSIPKNCVSLAFGDKFKFQAFKYKKCYAFQFHPEVNFRMHLRWLLIILFNKPRILFTKEAQNIFYQIFLRFKYNKPISNWLDYFLDNYLLEQ